MSPELGVILLVGVPKLEESGGVNTGAVTVQVSGLQAVATGAKQLSPKCSTLKTLA